MQCAMTKMELRKYFILCILIGTIPILLSLRKKGTPIVLVPTGVDKTFERRHHIYDNTTTEVPHSTPRVMQHQKTYMTFKGMCTAGHPVKHFLMTKTEKTGSTTVYGPLARYAIQNKLEILMPTSGLKIDWQSKKGWTIRPGGLKRAEVLVQHAVYNQTMIDKHMMPDIKLITLAREPVSWFISAVNFFQWRTGDEAIFPHFQTPRQVLRDDQKLYKRRGFPVHSWFHIPQLLWSGFDYQLRNNLTAIKDHINQVVNRSDVIILTDQLDASLLILKKRFCWSYTDIFNSKYKVKDSTKRFNLTTAGVKKLLSPKVNLGDKMFFDKLSEAWWSQPELTKDFWNEVKYFSELNFNATTKWCKMVNSGQEYVTIPASQWHGKLYLDKSICDIAANTDDQYLERKISQYGETD